MALIYIATGMPKTNFLISFVFYILEVLECTIFCALNGWYRRDMSGRLIFKSQQNGKISYKLKGKKTGSRMDMN